MPRRLPRSSILIACAVLLAPAAAAQPQSAPAGRAPNIVIVFADDLGYADLGVYGAAKIRTPHLDRMAAEGMRFTSFYVAQPVCSASRAALLTGCYPNRVGIAGALGPSNRIGIHAEETTLAEVCKSRGYATAIFGKWHLGWQRQFLPLQHGFDEFLGIPYSNDMWPLHPDYADLPPDAEGRKRGYPDLPLFEGNEVAIAAIQGADQAQFTRRFTDRAVAFIEKHRDTPFFLYVPHPMPHVPLFVSPQRREKSPGGLYGDVIEEIDLSVGRILDALRRTGVEEHTLVIFTSDNGPWLSYGDHAGTVGRLREGKGTTWEGGVRVPFIARWPGRIPAGRVCDEPVMTIDLLPTIAGLIGAPPPARRIDGRDIAPLLRGEPGAKSPHEALYFYYHLNDLEAVRSGDWKLMLPHDYRTLAGAAGSGGRPAPYKLTRCETELYNLVDDPGETQNVAAQNPEVVERMMKLVARARADLGDDLTKTEGANRRPHGKLDE